MKKAIFLSVVSALYKVAEADLAEDLKDAVEGEDVKDDVAEKILKKLDANKVSKFKEEATERFDNGVKKGQKETAKKFEKKLRSTFEIDDDTLEGEDLLSKVEEVSTELKSKSSGKGDKPDLSAITPEDLEKIPAFINKNRDFQKQLKDKDAEKELAVNEVKNEIKKNSLKSKASNLALAKLNERNPILPQDASKAEKMKNKLLVEELSSIPFMEAEDGSLIPLNEEGKPRTNANGVEIDFDMLVNGIIESNFEFAKTDERKSPSNKNDKSSSSSEDKKYTGKAPTSSKEYLELLTNPDLSIEEKASVKEQYREQFS